jgi:hypothetical protein
LVVKLGKLFEPVDGGENLKNRGPAICFNALVPLTAIIVDSAFFDAFQEGTVKVQAMTKVASNAIFGKRMLDVRVCLIVETAEHFESLSQYSKVFLL